MNPTAGISSSPSNPEALLKDSDNNNHININNNTDNNDVVDIDNLPIILDGNFFKIQSRGPGTKVKARCELCKQKDVQNILSGAINSTTNFRTHLKRLHPEDLSRLDDLIQAQTGIRKKRKCETPSTSNQTESKLKQSKIYDINHNKRTKQNRFDENIMNYIVSSMKPLSTVDDPNFRKICKDLDDRIEIMSRRTLNRKVNEEYMSVKNKLKANFKSIKYVSTTADIWSTKHRSFMGVTAHWIDEKSLERHSAVLACTRFKGSHTYDRIAEVLYDINSEYGLEKDKLISTVTDNGSNFVKSFKEFGYNLCSVDDKENSETEDSSEDVGGRHAEDLEFIEIEMNANTDSGDTPSIDIALPNHIRCASHTLNLLATTDFNKALKGSSASRVHHTALAKCTQLWNLSRKPKSSELIVELLGVSLIYPCPTRWNSLYDSISHLLKFRSSLNNLLHKLQLSATFKDFELEYLHEYCTIMKPIAQALDHLQSEKNFYFGSLMPTLFSLKGRLDMTQNQNLRHCKPLLSCLVTSLDKRFANHFALSSDVNDAIIAACVHPQFKLKWLPPSLCEMTKARIQHMCVNAIGSCCANETLSSSSGDDDNFFILTTPTHKERSATELEFMSFFNDTNKSILSLNNYPEVKRIFIKYNTSLCASAPVERLFSFAGFIHAPTRGSLSDKTFETIVFLKGNGNYAV